MFPLFNFSSIFQGGQLTPFAPMCGRPCICCVQWSYIAFLGVLSYFVLTELRPFTSLSSISVCELIVGLWFVSHVVEELIQVGTHTQTCTHAHTHTHTHTHVTTQGDA